MPFFYVCILTDIDMQSHHYTGFTADLQERLARHNRGAVPATASLAKGDQYSFSSFIYYWKDPSLSKM